MWWATGRNDDEFGRRRRRLSGAHDAGRWQTRILIVEDEWLVSLEMESTLQEAGFEVVGVAASAETAISMAEALRPNLVLMDIRLNGPMDGVGAAVEIRRRFGAPCLFVSANADQQTRERADLARPVGWVLKPFSSPQLLQAVDRAVDRIQD